MKRYLEKFIKKDLNSKIVFLTGPRQVGKTTLSKMVMDRFDYLNYDIAEDRLSVLERVGADSVRIHHQVIVQKRLALSEKIICRTVLSFSVAIRSRARITEPG